MNVLYEDNHIIVAIKPVNVPSQEDKTGNKDMLNLAMKVKEGTVSADEIAQLVAFAKESGGIEYAEKKMLELHNEALQFISDYVCNEEISDALKAYLDFVIQRKS